MLTSEQAAINHEKYGFNELVEEKRKSTIVIFFEQFKDFLLIVLLISAVLSGFMGDIQSALVIFAVIIIDAVLGTVQTIKAENSLNALKQMSAPDAKVIRDGITIKIPSREVTIDDEVVLEAGDMIPADGVLIDCASLKVDESALTGESLPSEKSLNSVPDTAALGDQTNKVFSGSFVTYGRASYKTTAIGMGTEVGKIAGLLKTTSEKRTPLQKNLDDFGKKLTMLIILFCGILFGINVYRGGKVSDAFMFAVALAVAAIPEALSSIVTIVLSFGTQKMAKEHAIVRKLQAVEGLGSVSVICSDKTGTLTQNKMTVEKCYTDGITLEVDEINIDDKNQNMLIVGSILCNDSIVSDEKEIGDPTETALVRLGDRIGISSEMVREKYTRLSELPFDSDRKIMSTLNNYEGKNIILSKGAVDVLLPRMKYILSGNGKVSINDDIRVKINNQNTKFSSEGLRVLALAYKEMKNSSELALEDENDLVFVGLIAMMDPLRDESKAAVEECIKAGIKPVMITGDHKITAAAIAKKARILTSENEACEGADIEDMSDEELREFVTGKSVYARVSPEHKIRIVRAWQERGSIVAMTGDGVNDAPALKQSDIGVAMGITGTEVAKDAASMVLTDDNFATIVKAVENGRNVYKNIKSAIQFLLSGNFGAILAVLYASIAGLHVPFAPVHLLFINLLTDSLPAIALGLEPHSKYVMKEKPRPSDETILTRDFLLNIFTEGLCIGVTTMTAYMIGLNTGGNRLAMTMAFATLCTGRLVHGFNCKSGEPVAFTKRFFDNKYLLGAFALGLILITTVVSIPALNSIFTVTTLSLEQILIVFGLALVNLLVIQILKFIRRAINKHQVVEL